MSSHLCAGKEVRVSLDPCNDLTQDYTIGEYVGLKTDRQTDTIVNSLVYYKAKHLWNKLSVLPCPKYNSLNSQIPFSIETVLC